MSYGQNEAQRVLQLLQRIASDPTFAQEGVTALVADLVKQRDDAVYLAKKLSDARDGAYRQLDEARGDLEAQVRLTPAWGDEIRNARAERDEARMVVRQLCDELGFTPTERWAKRYPWMVEVE